MKITVDVDGGPIDCPVHLALDELSIDQAIRLEKVMGADRVARLFSGGPIAQRTLRQPSTVKALIYVQVADVVPDLKMNDLKFDLADLYAELGLINDDTEDTPDADNVVALPMQLEDGSTVEGASVHVDPTQPRRETGLG